MELWGDLWNAPHLDQQQVVSVVLPENLPDAICVRRNLFLGVALITRIMQIMHVRTCVRKIMSPCPAEPGYTLSLQTV